MSRIVESLYTISGINLQESNLDKSTAIVGKISNIIEKYLPDYDVIYTDNTITVSNGRNIYSKSYTRDKIYFSITCLWRRYC